MNGEQHKNWLHSFDSYQVSLFSILKQHQRPLNFEATQKISHHLLVIFPNAWLNPRFVAVLPLLITSLKHNLQEMTQTLRWVIGPLPIFWPLDATPFIELTLVLFLGPIAAAIELLIPIHNFFRLRFLHCSFVMKNTFQFILGLCTTKSWCSKWAGALARSHLDSSHTFAWLLLIWVE